MSHCGERPALRLGFLGAGWIGRSRLQSVVEQGAAAIAVVADPAAESLEAAARIAPQAEYTQNADTLLSTDLDGVVIATPSALHAEQAMQFLERGVAVFCQKPLGRDADEVARVVEVARTHDRLLGVDFCYRYTAAARALWQSVHSGELGTIFAAELVFHNAYGPDKPWFYERQLSGGGCLMDLGIHLVDTALWLFNFPEVCVEDTCLYAAGMPIAGDAAHAEAVEDYAAARLRLSSGASVRLCCSWNLSAGQDAVIQAAVYGQHGAVNLFNVDGSFYDFAVDICQGTSRRRAVSPPDSWGGRAVCSWIQQLQASARFDEQARQYVQVARVVDAVYQRGARN